MTRATKTVEIKPEEWYSLQDVVKKHMFVWCASSYWSVRNVVALDRRNKNILKATIIGTGRATKYRFKGENIINFIKLVDAGEIQLS